MHTDTLKVTCKSTAIKGHRRTNARNNGIKIFKDGTATVVHFWVIRIQFHVALFDVQEDHLMATRFTCFDKTLV